jgi:hypothetical protein
LVATQQGPHREIRPSRGPTRRFRRSWTPDADPTTQMCSNWNLQPLITVNGCRVSKATQVNVWEIIIFVSCCFCCMLLCCLQHRWLGAHVTLWLRSVPARATVCFDDCLHNSIEFDKFVHKQSGVHGRAAGSSSWC